MEQDAGIPLKEAHLKTISRNIRTLFPEPPSSADVTKLNTTFDAILRTASTPNLAATHKVAAWNALCACVDRCAQHQDETYSSLTWEGHWWERAFDLYVSQAGYARPKSAKQLLDSLTTALQRLPDDGSAVKSVKERACRRLVTPLLDEHDGSGAKTSALALAYLLARNALSFELLLRMYAEIKKIETPVDGGELASLLGTLFGWMSNGDFSAAIGRLVSVILDQSDGQHRGDEKSDAPIWATALRRVAKSGYVEIDSYRTHLLPALFLRSFVDYKNFLHSVGVESVLSTGLIGASHAVESDNTNMNLLLASLQCGNDIGLLRIADTDGYNPSETMVALSIEQISELLQSSLNSARLAGFSMLTSSTAITRPVPPSALHAFKSILDHFLADTDTDFRSEVFSIMQRLIDRIRAVTATLARQASKAPPGVLQYHKDFLGWLMQCLQWQLTPTASYQRHISALKCLTILARSGLAESVPQSNWSKSALLGEIKWPFRLSVLNEDLRVLLLDLTIDPYDDVRQGAAALLAMYPDGDSGSARQISQALERAEATMLQTGRADQADGVAHLYTLLYKSNTASDGSIMSQVCHRLMQMLNTAKTDLGKAVSRYPIHGLLTSLRYMLEAGTSLDEPHASVVRCLEDVWAVVKPILCNDAPEGYLPEDMDEVAEVSTKNTLSYCWRSLKEGSLLTGAIIQRVQDPFSDMARQLYELCFTQLAELRHSGAFSTVAQTWTTCCLRSYNSDTGNGSELLQKWYDRVLQILQNNTTINTRRSAGLPSLLCGILIADKDGSIFRQAFVDLEIIARTAVKTEHAQEGSLSQVHALNCLRDVLKTGRLGEASEQYVPRALVLAADALQSEVWAVRNCGLMLFRAVIDRLLGTSGSYLDETSQSHKQLSAAQYPQLLDIVLDLLKKPAQDVSAVGPATNGNESVFPAMQLLQRLSVPDYKLDSTRMPILDLMGNRVWHIRDKAARTYAWLGAVKKTGPLILQLIGTPLREQDRLHGALLCAKYFVRRLKSEQAFGAQFGEWRMAVQRYKSWPVRGHDCVFVKAAFVDLLAELTARDMVPELGSHADLDAAAPGTDLAWTLHELIAYMPLDGQGAALRAALARLLACQTLQGLASAISTQDEMCVLLLDLAKRDADACVAFIAEVIRKLPTTSKTDVIAAEGILTRVCESVLGAPILDRSVQTVALQMLLYLRQRGIMLSFDIERLRHAMARKCVSIDIDIDQSFADLALEARAAFLEEEIKGERPLTANLVVELRNLAESCRQGITDLGFYSTRAAALALSELDKTWNILSRHDGGDHEDILQTVCMTVYDLLNDDDEDLRTIASEITTRILKHNANSLLAHNLPSISARKLLAFMTKRWRNSQPFAIVAIRRAFGIVIDSQPNVAERLQRSTHTDMVLFVEEKQNLYIDDMRETKTWSRVVMGLSPSLIVEELLVHLGTFAHGGLRALIPLLQGSGGGPLSWTSKPDAFTLGLQFVYCAEVLLHLAETSNKITVQPSALHHQLMTLSAHEGCHCLWRREIDRIVSHAAAAKLSAVHALIARTTAQAHITAGGMSQ
ncbi:hypothetical protein LTR62_002788 [Meristemomyces frigidus]|uniref:DUF2428 domain-containing protein n=1 Tax=Meristemomyces frigidus TaxID=1508187 RepID=A0AAN7TWW2_9PEZI|nr:hypothetical protein LTR62_002788 [Meristemomyces frigidus]